MKENIIKLKNKFIEIKSLGWIEGSQKGTGSLGNKFESLINNSNNNFEIPDYKGIEIKTKNANRSDYITMFCATPDGYLFQIKRLHQLYAYPDKQNRDLKVFNISVVANHKTRIGYNRYCQLSVDNISKKITLNIFNEVNKLMDKETSWSFAMLEEKLNRKMETLALIDSSYMTRNGKVFYKYNNISFYELKSFNDFIKAVEPGYIRITFKISVFRNGLRAGQIHDHGTSFDINKNKLNSIYKNIQF